MRRQIPQLQHKPGTALVLSGGATKAFYFHIGVLKVLKLHEISSIVGTSAGAIAGALVASGVSVDSLIASIYQKEVYIPRYNKVVRTLTSTMMFRPHLHQLAMQGIHTTLASMRFFLSLPWLYREDLMAELLDRLILSQRHSPSFFTANEVEKLFHSLLSSNEFSKTEIDLYITATGLDNNLRAVFNGLYDFTDDHNSFMSDVPMHRAVRASMSIPGMFEPVKIKDNYYIDGEVRQTLSMDIGLSLADRIIISHTYCPLTLPPSQSVRNMGWVNIIKQSVHIALHERIAAWRDFYAQQYPEKEMIWIEPEPDDVEFFLSPEFSFRPEVQKKMIHSGEAAALKALGYTPVNA
jgi:NTE family protein